MIRTTITEYTFDISDLAGDEMLRSEIITMARQLGKMAGDAGLASVGLSETATHVVVKVNEIDAP
jgi:hypothetical protein